MKLFDNIKTYIQDHKELGETIQNDFYRKEALSYFLENGLPSSNMESWRESDIIKTFDINHLVFDNNIDKNKNFDDIFSCDINISEFDNYKSLNGNIVKDNLLDVKPNGVIIGSIKEAKTKYAEIFKQYYSKASPYNFDGLVAANTAMAEDGFFIYIPDDVKVEKPIRMINITHHNQNTFSQYRNLVILGKNSEVSIIQCDDSGNLQRSLSNVVSEYYLDENAHLKHYKLQNINDNSSLIHTSFFEQKFNSKLLTQAITLNGGNVRNVVEVSLNEKQCHADVLGLYIVDKEQKVENQVKINHNVPNCTSNQSFKGILDDHSHASFNGHILVERDAQKTEAFQNCNNIAISDKVIVNTQPFLEIYADDVKCSHGATIGQIEENALFYLRTRGINEDDATLLLLYAFAAELLDFIDHDLFRDSIDNMIKKRLRGEFSSCEQCVLLCNNPEHNTTFNIEMDKI